MPTIEELGQKVKTKYPDSYNDLSDLELGQRVKSKFPGSYDDFVETQQPQRLSFLQRLGGGLDTAFGGGIVGKGLGTSIAKLGLTGLRPEERQFVSPPPSAGEYAGDIGQIGLTLGTLGGAGTAGRLGARFAKSAVLGAGFGTAGALKEKDGVGEIAKGAATGGAIGGAIPIAGAGIKLSKTALLNILPKSIVRAYIPSVKDVTEHVLENTKLGFTRTMLNNAKSNVKQLSNKIDSALEKYPNVLISKNDLFRSVAQSYGQTGGGGTITGSEVEKIVRKIVPEVKGFLSREVLNLKDANKVRKAIDLALGDRFFLTKHSPFTKEVAGAFNSFLRETVKNNAKETIPIFNELSKEINVRNGLNQAVKKFGRVNLRDLISVMAGTTAGATAGIGGAISGGIGAPIIERALSSQAVGVGVAKGLYRLGKKSTPEGIKNLVRLGILRAPTE